MSNKKEPVLSWKLTPDKAGLVVNEYEFGNPAFSLDEASQNLPGGAYTTLRTYSHSKVMRIEDHFLRLAESSQRAIAEFIPKVTWLRPAFKNILHKSPYPEARVRITLDLERDPGTFYITLERLHIPPDEAYRDGVRVISRSMQRDNPKAKLTNFLITAAQYRSQLPQSVNELLMVDQTGVILEGLSSNFYGMLGGTIRTMDEGVLPGITRGAVLEIAARHRIPVIYKGIRLAEVSSLDECFITSASRGVLPVIQIDDTTIGGGKPGEWTRKLILLFAQWVEKNIEEI